MIMHIDMDAFFASVEQRVNPALRGKPVIIGGRNNKYRSIICAASYEAKALGVTNAMPSWKALKICPQAIFVAADSPKYIYTSDEIYKILQTFSPQVEKFSIDEFFLGIDGCEKLFGPPAQMGQRIKERIKERFGLTCSVGVGPTKITAKLAAKLHKPDGLCVLEKQDVARTLRALPVEKICGIGERLKARFNALGVRTCGELAGYPPDVLKRHFGVVGLWLKMACLAEDVSVISDYADSAGPPKSVGHSQTLREATDDEDFIRAWIYLLSEMVGQRLRARGLQGKTVHFYLSDGFSGGIGKQKTFSEPTYDGQAIYARCLAIIRLLRPMALCARVLAVSVSGLAGYQNNYLFEHEVKRDRLLRHVDKVNDKYGPWTIHPASLKQAIY